MPMCCFKQWGSGQMLCYYQLRLLVLSIWRPLWLQYSALIGLEEGLYSSRMPFFMQYIIGVILAMQLGSKNAISKSYAYIVMTLISFFVSGFTWSWSPLGWLIPSEIFPLETLTAGFLFAVSTSMICTFIIAQAFFTCHMRWSIFFFCDFCEPGSLLWDVLPNSCYLKLKEIP